MSHRKLKRHHRLFCTGTDQWAMQESQDPMQDMIDYMEFIRQPRPWTEQDEARLDWQKRMYEKYIEEREEMSDES